MFRSSALLLLLATGAVSAADHDRRGRVEGRLFVSPMGEPFRSGRDGDPEAMWFASADSDGDGRISLAEFQADAVRWFGVIDRGHEGEIDPDDIDWYENELVPEIRVADAPRGGGARSGGGNPGGERGRDGGMGGGPAGGGGMGGHGGGMGGPGGGMGDGGGGMSGGRHGGGGGRGGAQGDDSGRAKVATATREGAARYSYLDLPEPLTAADANFNRGIDKGEMIRAAADRFALLDKNGDGFLEKRELPRVDTRSSGLGPHASPPRPDRRPDDRQLGGGDREQD